MWKHKSGVVTSLVTGTLLHGTRSSSEIELWADGVRIVLVDPHTESAVISVRVPGSSVDTTEEVLQEFIRAGKDIPPAALDTDPHFLALQSFVEAVRTQRPEDIRSSYWDAARTHELAFAIEDAVQRSKTMGMGLEVSQDGPSATAVQS